MQPRLPYRHVGPLLVSATQPNGGFVNAAQEPADTRTRGCTPAKGAEIIGSGPGSAPVVIRSVKIGEFPSNVDDRADSEMLAVQGRAR
jgi:hypothetical protein